MRFGEAFWEVEATERRAVLTGSLVAPLAVILGGPDNGTARIGAGGVRVERLSPADALAELLAGNRRFADGTPRYGHHVSAAVAAAGEQKPIAVVLGCIDSRVPLEAVFDQGFGAICVIRSAGHVLDRAVLGSVEFAVAKLQVSLLMVLGHSRCGAVQAAITNVHTGHRPAGSLGFVVDEIAPAVHQARANGSRMAVVRAHTGRTVTALTRLEQIRSAVGSGSVEVVGAVYDLDSGRVETL
jgi:carbonic anhydrase